MPADTTFGPTPMSTDQPTATDQQVVPIDQPYTLTEAAKLTGLSVEALRQRIKRRTLVATKGNDGLMRVRLSPTDLSRLAETGHNHERPTGREDGQDYKIKVLEAEATGLREALSR